MRGKHLEYKHMPMLNVVSKYRAKIPAEVLELVCAQIKWTKTYAGQFRSSSETALWHHALADGMIQTLSLITGLSTKEIQTLYEGVNLDAYRKEECN